MRRDLVPNKRSKQLSTHSQSFIHKLLRHTVEVLFKSSVRSSLEYAAVVWDGCSESESNLLESLQIERARVVTGALKGTSRVSLLNELSWVDLSVRRKLRKLSLMYKMVFKLASPYLCDLCPDFFLDRSCNSLRSARNLCSSYVRTERHKNSFLFSSTKWWNSLPLEIRSSSSLGIFKHNLLKYLQLYWGSFSANISHLLAT